MTHARPRPLTRRALGAGVLGVAVLGGAACAPSVRPRPAGTSPSSGTERSASARTRRSARVAALEKETGTRIGLVAHRLDTGVTLEHRGAERSPLCSTFKPLVAAALLHRRVDLEELVRYADADLVDHSPITGDRRAMTVRELSDAAIRYSDNTAGNLLLRRLGGAAGPAALTRYLRTLGDDVTRLDRWETALNEGTPGDPRDTGTPRSLAATYRALLAGRALRRPDRRVLVGWMEANTTSVDRFRAGLPSGWRCADKTGGGGYGTQNDVGLLSAPDGGRIVFAILTRSSSTDPAADGDPTLMRSLAEVLVDELG